MTNTTSGTTTTTSYLGNLVEVTSDGTTTTTAYRYAAGKLLAEAVNGTLTYLVTTHQGSVSEALDTTGNVSASQLYLPYGGVRSQSGTMPTSYGYTGQRADVTTGLDYYGARYYDPTVGQFASADTLLAGGLNRYGYVKGNPTSWVDPSGHEEELESELDGGGGGFGGGDGSNGDATVSGGVSGGGTGVSGSGDAAVGNSLTTGPQTGISDSVLEVENPDGSITYFDPTVTEGDLEAETQEINQTKQQLRDNDPQKPSNTPHTSDNSNDNGQNNGNGQGNGTSPNVDDLVKSAENARTENGTSHAAGATTNLTDANGNPITATSGQATQSPAGIGDGSTCAECHLGQEITNNYAKGSLNGQTINVGVAQVRGLDPCETCRGMFGELAQYTGANISVWYGIRAPGGLPAYGPIIGIMGPLEFLP